jgi:hypothetical protein
MTIEPWKIYAFIIFAITFVFVLIIIVAHHIKENKICSGGGFHKLKYSHSDRVSDTYTCTKCKCRFYKMIPHY